MKKYSIISLITIIALLSGSHSLFSQEQGSNQNASGKAKVDMVYQCPTDLGVISNVSGHCSKCGSKLVELTMDEAMDNLSGGGHKKPELKNKRINIGKGDKIETEEISPADAEGNLEEEVSEVTDNESNSEIEKNIDVSMIDLNRDGKVYQCIMCPDQLSDESDYCEKCYMELTKIPVEDAQKNLSVYENKSE